MVRTPGSVDISISNNLEDEPGDIQNQFVLKRPEILGKYKKMRIRSTRHNCLTAKCAAVRGLWTQSRMDPIDVPLMSFFLHSSHHCVAQFEWLVLVLCVVYFALVARIISLNSLLRALPYTRLSFRCHGVVCVLVSWCYSRFGVWDQKQTTVPTAAGTDNWFFIPGSLYNLMLVSKRYKTKFFWQYVSVQSLTRVFWVLPNPEHLRHFFFSQVWLFLCFVLKQGFSVQS